MSCTKGYSVTKSCLTLQPYELWKPRLLCSPLSPRVCSNSCPLGQWCCLIISSSFVPFCFCLQSFPSSEPFPMSQLFTSGGQSLGASDAATTLPKNIQDWFPLGLTGFISCNPRDFKESSPAPWFKSNNSLVLSLLYDPTLTSTHNYWKNHSFAYMDLVSKVRSLLFNKLSRFVIAFLLRSKYLLISWM